MTALAFSHDGHRLFASMLTSAGPRLAMWDTRAVHRMSLRIAVPEVADSLEVSSDGSSVAASGNNVWLIPLNQGWDDEAEECRRRIEALTGSALTDQGDMQWLDAQEWSQQLAVLPPVLQQAVASRREVRLPRAFVSSGIGNATPIEALVERLAERLAERPDNWALRLQRADFLLRQSELDEASEELEIALRQVDRSQLVIWFKRQISARFRRFGGIGLGAGIGGSVRPGVLDRLDRLAAEALWYCEQLLRIAPDDPMGRLMYVNLLLDDEQFDKAEAAFDAALQGDLRNLMLENLRTGIGADIEDLAASQRRLRRAGRPGTPQAEGSSGERFAAHAQKIQWLLDHLMEQQPEAWELLMARAELLAITKRVDEAVADIVRARQLAPDGLSWGQLSRFVNYAASAAAGARPTTFDRMSAQTSIWEKVIEADPERISATLANYHGRLANWDQAAHWHQQLAVANPDDFTARYYLAALLLKLNRVDEYREHCRQLLAGFGESTSLLIQRRAIQTCLWHDAGAQDGADLVAGMEAIFDRVTIALHWRQTTLALAHLRSGNASEAKATLEEVLQSQVPASCEVRALATLSLAYLADQDEAKARETLQRATKRFTEAAPEFGSEDLGGSWHGWLVCDVLLAEAKARLEVPEDTPVED